MIEFPPKRILVPIDFSPPAMAGFAAARELAKSWNAKIELVHVDEVTAALAMAGEYSTVVVKEWLSARDARGKRLAKLAEGIPGAGSRVAEGYLSSAIVGAAKKAKCDMIVMGTHGYTGWKRMVLGSAAESVVRESHVPVLTLHAERKLFSPKKILVPMNFTEYADEAFKLALRVSSSFSARVCAINAVEAGALAVGRGGLLEAHLESLAGKEAAAKVRCLAVKGSPAEVILTEAEKGRFDLIVLSAHRKSFLEDAVLGMTAERILRYSNVPVLSVPSGKASSA